MGRKASSSSRRVLEKREPDDAPGGAHPAPHCSPWATGKCRRVWSARLDKPVPAGVTREGWAWHDPDGAQLFFPQKGQERVWFKSGGTSSDRSARFPRTTPTRSTSLSFRTPTGCVFIISLVLLIMHVFRGMGERKRAQPSIRHRPRSPPAAVLCLKEGQGRYNQIGVPTMEKQATDVRWPQAGR